MPTQENEGSLPSFQQCSTPKHGPSPSEAPAGTSQISAINLECSSSPFSSDPQNDPSVPLQSSSKSPPATSQSASVHLELSSSSSSTNPPINPSAPLPSTPVSCAQSEASSKSVSRECNCNFLTKRVEKLEEKVDTLMKNHHHNTFTPKRPIFKPTGSVQKGERVQIGRMSGSTLYSKFSILFFQFLPLSLLCHCNLDVTVIMIFENVTVITLL